MGGIPKLRKFLKANYTPNDYLKQVLQSYDIHEPEKFAKDQLSLDQAKQIVINAQIALRKSNFSIWRLSGQLQALPHH